MALTHHDLRHLFATFCIESGVDIPTVSRWLKVVSNWSIQAQTICRTFKFEGFMTSVDFVRRIAKQTLKINHQPDIEIHSDKVKLTLSTYDEGGLSEKDFSPAKKCDELYARFLTE